jgi:hypothetical protein
MKHIVITRVNFSNDEKFNNYFEVMKKHYIPSLNNQTNKNFILGLNVNPKHYQQIRDLIHKDIEIVTFNNVKEDYRDYVINNNINVQTRHDCDDYMVPDYINFIQKTIEDHKSKMDSMILTFQPTKLDYITGKEFIHERDYSKVCSMFSTLYQEKVVNGIHDVMHDHLRRLTRNILYFNNNYVKLLIHNNNLHSKLQTYNTELK